MNDIYRAIPHRPPFLFVDEIVSERPDGLVARRTFRAEDFFYAGGIRGLMSRMKQHLHLDCLTVTGKTLGENIEGAEVYNDDVIRSLDAPIYAEGSLAVLTYLAERMRALDP